MDLQIVTALNHFGQGTRLDIASQIISRRRGMLIIRSIVIALVLFFKRKYWKYVLMSFLFAAATCYIVAEWGCKTLLVQDVGIRPRPYVAHTQEIKPIGRPYTDSSFPSSHMAITLAMLTVLIILYPKLRPYAIVYTLLMARSRMHNGMHYPSDVLTGALMGIFCGRFGWTLSKKANIALKR